MKGLGNGKEGELTRVQVTVGKAVSAVSSDP